MRYFTNQTPITAIKRQTYSGNKSTYSTTGTASCYMRALDEVQASVNGLQYGTGFSLIVETAVDIRPADIVTIGGVDYTVRGVVNHSRGGITAYKKCLVTKPE